VAGWSQCEECNVYTVHWCYLFFLYSPTTWN